MENSVLCPVCHATVKPTDYFCSNCGKNLKPEAPSTSLNKQIIIYLESFFLPPYGIIIGLRYLRAGDSKSKTVGIISIVLTIISLLILIKFTFDLINIVNSQVYNQLQNMEF
ncbi:MAG: hypothetical protein A2Z35_01475 [Actinobacteria bacterium RBG_19FT_COMBO_36_27]|nr:MAG: hypothetical protein A2Z35_01475 [Actinobacteria bacterium RBG_19FT_COMBO_36_27]